MTVGGRGIAVALAVLLVVTPGIAPGGGLPGSRNSDGGQAKKDAEAAAKQDANWLLWGGVGFLTGCIGVTIAVLAVPAEPPSRLIGKSSEYVAAYTSAYHDEMMGAQGAAAVIGCCISTAIAGVIVAVYYLTAP